jgi:biopolymer transport protein ExbB
MQMRRTPGRLAVLILVLAAAALPALAQATNAAAATNAPAAAGGLTWSFISQQGGRLMYVIAALSVGGLALIIYYAITLTREQLMPAPFVEQLRGFISGRRLVEAQAACRASRSALAAILDPALDYRLRTPNPDRAHLKDVVESEGARQATRITNLVQYLYDIAVVAPMVGLLGTVVGMMQAFNVVAFDIAKVKPMELAGGVGKALITTVGGLIVAIPAMMAYAYFRNRVANLISDLEISANAFTLQLAEPDAGPEKDAVP